MKTIDQALDGLSPSPKKKKEPKAEEPKVELIGRNARLNDGIYVDDYMAALNKFVTVDEVMGEHKGAIAEGEYNVVARLVMETLGKSEWENHLVSIVMKAAKTGEWKAVERGPQHMPGLDLVVKKHLGYVVEHEGKTFLLPSVTYLAYCKEQL